jgi:DNA repair exonuclease SbcCD ATPase subunit
MVRSKKSLSDLLRQEVQEGPDIEVVAVPVEESNPPLENLAVAPKTNGILEKKVTDLEGQLQAKNRELQQHQEAQATLEKQLAKSQEQVQELTSHLEKQLAIAQAKIDTLTAQLGQQQSLETDLAKQTELSEKLYKELHEAQKLLSAIVPSERDRGRVLAKVPSYKPYGAYDSSAAIPSNLTDADIGWFD